MPHGVLKKPGTSFRESKPVGDAHVRIAAGAKGAVSDSKCDIDPLNVGPIGPAPKLKIIPLQDAYDEVEQLRHGRIDAQGHQQKAAASGSAKAAAPRPRRGSKEDKDKEKGAPAKWSSGKPDAGSHRL